jgi:DNA polymerase-3 subunit gamma/tau
LSELALYRKYRSGNFSEVIGQDHVIKTLTAALASNRLRHAYLFTGPKGVGKTSVARLLARALNCAGDPKPCNECASCQTAINSSLDIIEIDAASNRSIDAVRDLKDKISLAPSQGAYKVYIIDEVHMLTTEAFNALLKTLEEPPSHVVFILATTESHKLPQTIISRTQAFHFKPITTADITAQLADIAQKEAIAIEPAALDIIATAADGGFRDAISLLDQLGSVGATDTITAEHVRNLLGYSTTEDLAALSAAILSRDAAGAIKITTRLAEAGSQAGTVANQLAGHWRSALLIKSGARAAENHPAANLATAASLDQLAQGIEVLLEVVRSPWPQLALEASVVRLAANPTSTTAPAAAAPARPTAKTATAKPVPAPAEPTDTAAPLEPTLWPKVLVHVKGQNNSLSALLQMYPIDFEGDEITIKPRFNFHRDLFLKPANRTIIESSATKVFGRPIKISARTEDGGKKPRRGTPDPNSELVSSALEILGGEVVE